MSEEKGMIETNGWYEWKRLVLGEQERLADAVETIQKDLAVVEEQLAEWRGEIRSARWIIGLLAGGIGSVFGVIWHVILSGKH